MPYALIPEGFELKKVTKLQEEAVKAHRRHEDIVALLGNEKVPLLVAGGVAIGVLLPLLIAVLIQKLKDEGASITEELTSKVVKLSPAYWLFKVAETGTEKGLDIGTDINKFITDLGDVKYRELFKP